MLSRDSLSPSLSPFSFLLKIKPQTHPPELDLAAVGVEGRHRLELGLGRQQRREDCVVDLFAGRRFRRRRRLRRRIAARARRGASSRARLHRFGARHGGRSPLGAYATGKSKRDRATETETKETGAECEREKK